MLSLLQSTAAHLDEPAVEKVPTSFPHCLAGWLNLHPLPRPFVNQIQPRLFPTTKRNETSACCIVRPPSPNSKHENWCPPGPALSLEQILGSQMCAACRCQCLLVGGANFPYYGLKIRQLAGWRVHTDWRRKGSRAVPDVRWL